MTGRGLSRRAVLASGVALTMAPRAMAQGVPEVSLADAAERLVPGGVLAVPQGYTPVARTIRPATNRSHIVGVGPNASNLVFDPPAPSAAIELATRTIEGPTQSSIRGLGFHSANAVDKVAIALRNAANVVVEQIGIASGAWPGAGSTGIRTHGRQFVRIRDCDIACARPIVIGANPVFPTLAADFFVVGSCELVCTRASGACIEVEDGAVFSNVRIGDTALVGGAGGFRYRDRSSKGASIHLQFENVRTEQGKDPDGWSFDIDSSVQSIQTILFENVRCDRERNGIRIRNGQRITLTNVDIDQAPGRTALDIVFVPGTVLTIVGSFRQVGSGVRFRNARRVMESRTPQGDDFLPFEQWVYAAGAAPVDSRA